MSQWRVIGTPSTRVSGSPCPPPIVEVDRARERRQQDELREGDVGPLGEATVASKFPCGRSAAEDERPEDVNAMLAERAEPTTRSSPARLKPL
jgi:hypothetical protein